MPRDLSDVHEANRPFSLHVGDAADATNHMRRNAVRNLASMAENVDDFKLLVDVLGLHDVIEHLQRRRS